MVELIEYAVIFGISAGVAGASVMLVSGAMPGLGQVAAASTSDQMASAARLAAVEGRNVAILVPLHGASIDCGGGSLNVKVGGTSRTYVTGLPCSFDFSNLTGQCSLVFSAMKGSLRLGVSC